MSAASVTGISHHLTLGVNHLIGPRWDINKENSLKRIHKVMWVLLCSQIVTFGLIGYLLFRS
jgi:hypothetical protein